MCQEGNKCNVYTTAERNSDVRSFLRGIDVNRAPSTVVVDVEEDAGVSSPNSTVSSVMSGKRSERELLAAAAAGGGRVEDNEAERASCSLGGGSDDEDGGGNGDDGSRKKLRLSKEQALVLEETFKEHSTLNPVSGISVIFSLVFFMFFKKLTFVFLLTFYLVLDAEAKDGFG